MSDPTGSSLAAAPRTPKAADRAEKRTSPYGSPTAKLSKPDPIGSTQSLPAPTMPSMLSGDLPQSVTVGTAHLAAALSAAADIGADLTPRHGYAWPPKGPPVSWPEGCVKLA